MRAMPHALRLYPSRLLTAPDARLLDAPGDREARGDGGGERAAVALDGLVCGLCAARARRALAAVEGVRGVRVDLARGLATLEHEAGAPPSAAALRDALEGAAAGLRWRRLFARLAGRAARAGGPRRGRAAGAR